MAKKTQREFTYLDWLKFSNHNPVAKDIINRYHKKLSKLTGIRFMTCQGEMWRKLGEAYRKFKEQHKKPRRVSRDRKLKDTAQKQETRAKVGRRIRSPVKAATEEEGKMRSNPRTRTRKGYRIGSKAYLKRIKELGKERW